MKKNIIFFLPVFIPGGAGNAISRMCKNFNQNKYTLHIISIGPCSYKNELKSYVKKFYELKTKRTILSIFKLREIVKKLTKENNSIFVSNINYANVISVIALKNILNLKIILVERTALKELDIYFGFRDLIKKKITKLLIKIFYKKADKLITNSKIASKSLKELTSSKVHTIYSPGFIKLNKKKIKLNNIKKILTVGRLSREKDYETIIKAVNLIKHKNFILEIIGDGNQKNKLKNLIKKLKLDNKVFLRGYKKNPNIFFKRADLYINSSFFEGFPNSVIEAISYNLPVICTKSHGAINEIISNGKGGFFFETGNFYELSNLIDRFLISRKKFIKKTNFAKNNIKKFNIMNCTKAYQKIFEEL